MEEPFPLSSMQRPPPNNRKRTHDQITDIATRQSPCSIHEAESSISNARSFGLENIRMPAIHRFRGDGLDMRRPVMSTQPPQTGAQNVIDLTEDPPSPIFAPRNNVHPLNRRRSPAARAQRGPRYEREIIDADAVGGTPTAAVEQRESSPEVQFIRSRPRSQSTSSRSHGPGNHGNRAPTNPRPLPSASPNRLRARILPVPGLALLDEFDFGAFMAGRRHVPRDQLVQIDDWPLGDFEPPDFNFGLQGFNLEHPSRPIDLPPRLPTYDAPPTAQEGYTRDLKEDDVLICPNCDDELGVGQDDIKRQVWIVKSCGHVYCGECAKNRTASSKKLDPAQRTKPFKKCVAGDCGRNLSKSSMIQVYL